MTPSIGRTIATRIAILDIALRKIVDALVGFTQRAISRKT
jgi:hypothetical protein